MIAAKSERIRPEQATEDRDVFSETVNACSRGVEGDSGLVIVISDSPRADPQFKATAGQHVQRRGLLSQHGGMTQILIEHRGRDFDL